MALPQVTLQITPTSLPSTPPWMSEVVAFAQVLEHVGVRKAITEQVRFARARFGRYEVIDFVAVLLGYLLSGEPTLLAFYERLDPWAASFMALFGRDQLPHRSTLSRFLAALNQGVVESLRTLFQKDVLARNPFPSPGGLFDRTGAQWLVTDVDGTRPTAMMPPNDLCLCAGIVSPRAERSRAAGAARTKAGRGHGATRHHASLRPSMS